MNEMMDSIRQTFEKRFYAFNRSEYEAVQENCLDMLHAIAHERAQAGRSYDHDYRDGIITWYDVASLNYSIKQYQNYIKQHNSSWAW